MICVDDKENSGNTANTTTQKQKSSSGSSNHLRPTFDPKQQLSDKSADTTTKTSKSIIKPHRLPLNTDYNTTKLMYKASKSRQKTTLSNTHKKTTSGTNENVKNIKKKVEGKSKPTSNSPVVNRQEAQHTNQTQLIIHPHHQQQQQPSRD